MTWTMVGSLAPTPGGMLVPVQCCTDGSETYVISGGTVTQITGTVVSSVYTPQVGDRILVATAPAASGPGTQWNLTQQPANGIYLVTANSPNVLLTRAPDMAGSNAPAGRTVFVENNGNLYALNFCTVVIPANASAFVYGVGNIGWHTTGGISPTYDYLYAQSQLGLWNGAGWAQLIGNTSAAGTQTFKLPARASDTLAGILDVSWSAITGKSAIPVGEFVGTTDCQELTNKTETGVTVKGYTETTVALGSLGSTCTLDLTGGTVQNGTLTPYITTVFAMPRAAPGKSFVLFLKQPAGAGGQGGATFPGVRWPTTGAPTMTTDAGDIDIYTFFSDGANWYGAASQGYPSGEADLLGAKPVFVRLPKPGNGVYPVLRTMRQVLQGGKVV